MSWVDSLVNLEHDVLLKSLVSIPFTDDGAPVSPGALDLASLSVVRRGLTRPGEDLILELPRGLHDFAVFCGLFCQLTRMVARRSGGSTPLAFSGPVVVVGWNTQVQKRLRRIKVGGIDLEQGLTSCRIRSDGRIVEPNGSVNRLIPGRDQLLLYLNTRVGWPALPSDISPGVVVIDRTSFSDSRILGRALRWARENRAHTLVVVGDVGDQDVTKVFEGWERPVLRWCWSRTLIEKLVNGRGFGLSDSPLSTNPLLLQNCEGIRGALCESQAVDALFRGALSGLKAAGAVGGDFPRPVMLVRRLFNGLLQCLSTLKEFNQWAALDPRTTSFASLRKEIENSGRDDFRGPWRAFQEAGWGSLRYDVLELYRLIDADSPKFYGLAFLLDELLQKEPETPILVRVGSEAAGHALMSDLSEIGFSISRQEGLLRWATMSERRSWTETPMVEVFPGSVPPWQQPSLWTGESTRRIHLLYPFEMQVLRTGLEKGLWQQKETVVAAFRRLGLQAPSFGWDVHLELGYEFEVDRRHSSREMPRDQPSVDLTLLFADIEEEEDIREGKEGSVSGRMVSAVPVELQPGGDVWWVREGGPVEVLRREMHRHVSADDLRVGDSVIVPRGEGRENLFQRIVAAAHSRGDTKAYEVFFARWRKACWTVYELCGQNWRAMEQRMHQHGSQVTWQSFRLWAFGSIIGPDDAKDIQRIGRVAGDELIEQQYRRIAAMADEIRTLHRGLGRRLSRALSEVASGGEGPNLEAMTRLIGGEMDVDELLDEFAVRTVKYIGSVEEIPSYKVGRVVSA